MKNSTLTQETTSQQLPEKEEPSAKHVFLSKNWVHNVVKAIEKAKAEDESFRSLTYGFSLTLAYVITDLPENLRSSYGSDKAAIFIELEDGFLKKLIIDKDVPTDKNIDFTVKSSYEIAKKMFLGELKPATAFIKRKVKIKPFMKLYRDPAFTAKSIITINAILKIIKDVPTIFPE
jgi:putative sterol carrier protein